MTLTLNRMLVRGFAPVLLIALAFFISILQLVDLFTNITRYIDLEVPVAQIARVLALYVPKSLHFALPMGLLFAASFTLGTLYSNNELIAVLGAGVPLRSFIMPLVIVGILLSVGGFLFEEHVVIETYAEKGRLERELLGISRSESSSNVTRLGSGGRILYHADYYNAAADTLSGVTIVVRDDEGVSLVVHARTARWTGTSWQVQSARLFERDGELLRERYTTAEDMAVLTLSPQAFRRLGRDINEMRLEEARLWIESQREAGLPYRADLTRYHERFSFALTPFVVVLTAMAIGSRFRKNILLMSLLVALVISVIYYVTQMVSGLLAHSGYISPILGAWAGVILFVTLGIGLLNVSRT